MIVTKEQVQQKALEQKHIESSVKVYFTRDYKRFKRLRGNRKLNQHKIKKILQDMADGLNVLKYFPILVNEKMEILDGQHRFYVAEEKQENVYYIIAKKDFDLREIAAVNSRTQKWSQKDYIDCYIQLGDKNYEFLKQFIAEYKLSVSDAVNLLQTGSANSNKQAIEDFKAGNFIAQHKEMAEKVAATVNRFSFFPYFRNKSFIRAIQKIIEVNQCDFDRLVEQVEKRKEQFTGKVTVKEYLAQLELFYNHKLKSRVRIY